MTKVESAKEWNLNTMGLPSANSLTGYDARLLLGVRERGETFIPWFMSVLIVHGADHGGT